VQRPNRPVGNRCSRQVHMTAGTRAGLTWTRSHWSVTRLQRTALCTRWHATTASTPSSFRLLSANSSEGVASDYQHVVFVVSTDNFKARQDLAMTAERLGLAPAQCSYGPHDDINHLFIISEWCVGRCSWWLGRQSRRLRRCARNGLI